MIVNDKKFLRHIDNRYPRIFISHDYNVSHFSIIYFYFITGYSNTDLTTLFNRAINNVNVISFHKSVCSSIAM